MADSPTAKLYWDDARLTSFEATVLACRHSQGRSAVILDRTAFYPTGGGQPGDTGRLGRFDVTGVEIDDDGQILHWVAGAAELKSGEPIVGEIDPLRRREMTQQHTAQHIFSQSFFQLYGAETVGFRIAAHSTEIDLSLDAPADQLPEMIRQAELLANTVVFENRPIRLHQLSPAAAAALPLRKESFVTDCVRVVEIADFDWSPCGGTHAASTGEVGLIVVRSSERVKRMVRLHLLAGLRALADYRLSNEINDTLARRLSVGREDLDSALDRLQLEAKSLLRRNRELGRIAAEVEADQLCAMPGPSADGTHRIIKVFTDRDYEELKQLAHQLVSRPRVLALLATRDNTTARLVFARSADLGFDAGALMKIVTGRLGGRGGGSPEFAQGGVGGSDDLESVLADLAGAEML